MLAWGSSTDTDNLPYPELTVIAHAFADSVNSSGGVNGRVLSVLTCDDQGSAAGAQVCARQAVTQRVAAVIGSYGAHTEQALPILAAAGIAFLETAEPAGAGLRSPIAFPVIGGIPIQVFGAATIAARRRCTRVAVLAEDGLYPGPLAGFVTPGLDSGGGALSGEYRVSGVLGQLDPALAEATSNSDCLLIAADTQTTSRIIGAVQAHRYRQPIFMIGAGDPGRIAATYPELAGQVMAADPCPPLSEPQWRQYRDALANARDGWTVQAGGEAQRASWAAFEVFLMIGRRIVTFDAASVLGALRSDGPADSGGLLPPLDFRRDAAIAGMPRLANPNVTLQGFPAGHLERVTPGYLDLSAALTRVATPAR